MRSKPVAEHGEGPLLVLGAAGLGPDRGPGAAARGARPRGAAARARARSQPLARRPGRLRERAETLLDRPHEELWIRTYEEAAEALLREHSTEAGPRPVLRHRRPGRSARDPARPPRRAAAAPPRDPRQPGRAARPPAAADRRAQGRGGRARRRCASGRSRASAPPSSAAERERAEREIEFAELYARHDRILREAGSLDGGDLVLELGRLLSQPRRRRGGGRRSASAT